MTYLYKAGHISSSCGKYDEAVVRKMQDGSLREENCGPGFTFLSLASSSRAIHTTITSNDFMMIAEILKCRTVWKFVRVEHSHT